MDRRPISRLPARAQGIEEDSFATRRARGRGPPERLPGLYARHSVAAGRKAARDREDAKRRPLRNAGSNGGDQDVGEPGPRCCFSGWTIRGPRRRVWRDCQEPGRRPRTPQNLHQPARIQHLQHGS